jgi:cell fate regulator YaaT (PSP1 superfamily)
MAKDQDPPLNPSKISGLCGRLMCCLKYEHGVYVTFKRRAPKKGTTIVTPAGEGKVVDLAASADSVTVDHGEGRVITYRLSELELAKEDT